MTLDGYLLYLAAVTAFFATPPDTSQLLMISNSVRHGLFRSVFTIAGDLSANIVQMTAAAFGLAAAIAASATAFEIVKWLGVAYLAWMGLRLLLARTAATEPLEAPARARWRLYRQGFVTSMSNPFAVIFFGALFPQFIDPTGDVAVQLLVLGGTYLLFDGLILLLWGWLGIQALGRVKRLSGKLVQRICGAMMLAAAALLGLKDFEPRRA